MLPLLENHKDKAPQRSNGTTTGASRSHLSIIQGSRSIIQALFNGAKCGGFSWSGSIYPLRIGRHRLHPQQDTGMHASKRQGGDSSGMGHINKPGTHPQVRTHTQVRRQLLRVFTRGSSNVDFVEKKKVGR